MQILSTKGDGPLGEVLRLRAFRPARRDPLIPLHVRLKREPVLVMALGSRALRCWLAGFGRDGAVQVIQDFPLAMRPAESEIHSVVKGCARGVSGTAAGGLVVLLHAGWQASLVDRVTPERADERQRRLLGESMGAVPPSDGMLRLQVAHPVLAGGIQFQLPLSLVQEAAAIAEAAGLELLRLRLAPAAVLELLAARYASLVHGQDLLVADFQSVLLIECQDGRWSRVRFASNRPGELANDLGRHLRERSRPDAPLVLAGDPPVVELVRRLQPEIGLGLPPFQQANPSLDAALFA